MSKMTKKKDPSECRRAGRPKGAKNKTPPIENLTVNVGFRCTQADKETADGLSVLYRDIFRAGIAALASNEPKPGIVSISYKEI